MSLTFVEIVKNEVHMYMSIVFWFLLVLPILMNADKEYLQMGPQGP